MYNHQLDAFLKAADCGSFSKAAKELFITPTSLIQQINLLESKMEITLFNRTTHGITLTPAGESLYQDAKNIIRLSNNAIERARMLQGTASNEICIGTSLITKCRYLADYSARIVQVYPDLEVRLVSQKDPATATLKPLSELGTNFIMYEGLYLSELFKDKCNFLLFKNVPLTIAVPENHPLYNKDKIILSDLSDNQIVLLKPGISNEFDALRNEFVKNPKIHFQNVGFYDLNVFTSCELNNQLMITPAIWQDIHPTLKVIPFETEITVPYGLLYTDNLCTKAQLFIDSIKEFLELQN
ncbi:MAG: LysR family transcriptional regulator [Lachnospiraceae bacterium]|nr:LysR family transcriptional regulator [Lachnospiraceae bacterium]